MVRFGLTGRREVLKRGFVWSHPLDNGSWEIGLCTFRDDHNMGQEKAFVKEPKFSTMDVYRCRPGVGGYGPGRAYPDGSDSCHSILPVDRRRSRSTMHGSGWVGLAIAAIGFLLWQIFTWILGSPAPPKGRLTTWWELNGPDVTGGFFKRIPIERECLLKYTIKTIKATVGCDTTLVITSDPANRSVDLMFTRLTSINVFFSSGILADTGALFNEKAQSLADQLSTTPDPGLGECSIALPPSLSKVYKPKPEDPARPVFPAAIGPVGINFTTFRYDLGVQVDNASRAPDAP
ncbi:hypothetical protein VTL71DRAFT_5675 [Oculimacula yallundae]|uniref:Uncharacterized protein n=1 Tax=Oculimacula yallundae TaxID=86028 RepID=A0ABR4C0R2_9HELO